MLNTFIFLIFIFLGENLCFSIKHNKPLRGGNNSLNTSSHKSNKLSKLKTSILTLSSVISISLLSSGTVYAACSADINMNNNKILNLGTPTIATNAANKGYVDENLFVKNTFTEVSLPTSNTFSANITLDGTGLYTLHDTNANNAWNNFIFNLGGNNGQTFILAPETLTDSFKPVKSCVATDVKDLGILLCFVNNTTIKLLSSRSNSNFRIKKLNL